MEEADRNADRIAVIDHGVIVAQGKSADLKLQTKTETLEDAFLALTGKNIRETTGSDGGSRMKMWHGRR
jgi:ABC-2 type transport system ATP-binding protein